MYHFCLAPLNTLEEKKSGISSVLDFKSSN